MLDYKQYRAQIEVLLKENDTKAIYKILDDLDELAFINNYNTRKFDQKKYYSLVEKIPCGIIIHNPKTKIIYCNTYAQKILGLSKDEITGKKITDKEWQFLRPDFSILPINEHPVNQVIQTQKPISDYILGYNKINTQETLWLMISADPEFNEKNELISVIVSFIDITERIKTESALKENEEKFRFLTENILDVIWIIDVETLKYNYISPSILKLRGYTSDEVYNQSVTEAFSEESQAVLKILIPQRLKLFLEDTSFQEVYTDEVEQPCKNGLTVWTEIISYFRINPQTQKTEIIGTSRNITDRKNAQEALKQIRERLKILTDSTTEGIIVHKNGKIIDINPSFEKMIGIDNITIIGQNILDFIHPDYKKMLSLRIKSNTEGKTDIIIVREDKSSFPAEIEVNVVKLNNKNLGGVVVMRDITERKAAEEQIRKLSTAVTQSPAAIVITDTNGTIEYVNPHFTEITGYSFVEAIGNNPRILKSGEIPEETFKDLWITISSGNIWKGELLNKRKDGSLFWETAIIAPIKNEKGNIINYLAIKEDITSRKEAEDALRLSQSQLQEANATKDKFFSIIAHDLKNPFNIILGFSDLLLQNHKEYDLETRESVIKTIYDISLKTFNLLENLLAWSRSKSGNIPFNPKSIDIKLIAYDCVGLFKEAAEKKNIKLNLRGPEDIYVFADRDMIAAILRNFINNAIKFTRRDGKINVTIKKPENGQILVSVKDTGIGIRPEKIAVLFSIDRDWNTPGTEDEAGTGLGLFLCKEFIEKNGGKVWVESTVGEGTEFFFTIPSPN